MPPKKAAGGPSKKTENKAKDKTIEDKTFGLKNKKGAKTQKFVQHVTVQVKYGNKSAKQVELDKLADKKKKDAKKDEMAELNAILKPVTAMPKLDQNVDPKSMLCMFFKAGQCGKGNKCKFSHDLAIERKTEKRNLYFDARDSEKETDTMDNWDDAKLADVVDKKMSATDRANKTEIICKYFLEAVENSKYGWFWECPNGGSCIYRHALPQGYVLKKDKKKMDEAKEDQITIEDLVEKERAALGSNLTKVTYETFVAWKKRKLREKQKAKVDKDKKRQQEYKAGRAVGLSGRDLFTFNPDMVGDDDDEADDAKYEDEGDDEQQAPIFEINEDMFTDYLGDLDEDDDETVVAKASESNKVNGTLDSAMPSDEALFDEDDLPDENGDLNDAMQRQVSIEE